MEKFFSVSVEYSDGTTKSVAARGESHGSVFQQMKQMPGVRRVGKVTEVPLATHEAVKHGRSNIRAPEPRRPLEIGVAALNQPLRGPRVVLDSRPIGGEQPFKHLQAPPERPKPPQPVFQQPPPSPKIEEPFPHLSPEQRQPQPAPSDPTELEYRIVRSRRADGRPYLLQRGTWSHRDGKRNFKLDWEKGFDDRAKAEQHRQWVQQSAEELAAIEDEFLVDDESELTHELAEV